MTDIKYLELKMEIEFIKLKLNEILQDLENVK
jgi:hypothetical protein